MKEVECKLMRKQFHGFEIKIVFIGFEQCMMLTSLNINFLLSMVSSVLMEHHELLMSAFVHFLILTQYLKCKSFLRPALLS
jgi:hypothetical protein